MGAAPPGGRREDVDLAAGAALAASDRWARLDPYERERLLRRVAELIVQHNDELAAIESRDPGKPLVNARTIDVPRTAKLVEPIPVERIFGNRRDGPHVGSARPHPVPGRQMRAM